MPLCGKATAHLKLGSYIIRLSILVLATTLISFNIVFGDGW